MLIVQLYLHIVAPAFLSVYKTQVGLGPCDRCELPRVRIVEADPYVIGAAPLRSPVLSSEESILVLARTALELQQAVLTKRIHASAAGLVPIDELNLVLAHAETLGHLLRSHGLDRVVERLLDIAALAKLFLLRAQARRELACLV